jgi:Putative Ig domain.
MNEDPLELAVTDFVTKVGYPVETATPVYGNNLGPVTFFSGDLSRTGLTLDPDTGVLSGTAQAVADEFINVSVRDTGTDRVTSKPLHFRVLPNMQITLPTQVNIAALSNFAPIAPARNYVVGDAVWEELDQTSAKLPEGVTFDTVTGTFRGNAKEIGTFGPFTITSTDSLGDRGVSNSFVVKVNPGATFIGLAAAAQPLPDGEKRLAGYSYDFKQHLTYVGMDVSEITWSLGGGAPPGLKIQNGILSGTPTSEGVFTFEVGAAHGAVSARRSYTLTVGLPDISLTFTGGALPEGKKKTAMQSIAYQADLRTRTTATGFPADRVTYKLVAVDGEQLPPGIGLATNGVLSGTPTTKGLYTFTVMASFQDNTEKAEATAQHTIDVTSPIVIGLDTSPLPNAMKRLSTYSFDFRTRLDATTTGFATSGLRWAMLADEPGTELPPGLALSTTSGILSGKPTLSGTYEFIIRASVEGEEKRVRYTLVVDKPATELDIQDGVQLPEGELYIPYSFDLKPGLVNTNIPVSSIQWSAEGLPPSMTIANGVISGPPKAFGTFPVTVKASYVDGTDENVETTQDYTLTIIEGDTSLVNWTFSAQPGLSWSSNGYYSYTSSNPILYEVTLYDGDVDLTPYLTRVSGSINLFDGILTSSVHVPGSNNRAVANFTVQIPAKFNVTKVIVTKNTNSTFHRMAITSASPAKTGFEVSASSGGGSGYTKVTFLRP